MSNLFTVRDSDGYGHVVAADDPHAAVQAVQGALRADEQADGYHNGNTVDDNANAQFLGTTDLVPSGTVLSGISADEQEKRQNQNKTATAGGKAAANK